MKTMSKKAKFITGSLSFVIIVVLLASAYVLYGRSEGIKESATNYELLSEQKAVIMDDFNKIYSYDNYSIGPTEDGFKVSLRAEGYTTTGNTMICYFDSDRNFIDYEYIEPDIVDFYIEIIVIFVILGAMSSFVIIWLGEKLFD